MSVIRTVKVHKETRALVPYNGERSIGGSFSQEVSLGDLINALKVLRSQLGDGPDASVTLFPNRDGVNIIHVSVTETEDELE